MSATDENRFFSMGEGYDQMAPYMVPQYDFMQDEALSLAGIQGNRKMRIVDLGAGSGRLLEKAMIMNPEAECWWVDYSDDFLRVAKGRLEAFGNRVHYVLCPLEEHWEERVGGKVDAILSMSAIHHLESQEKQDLYRRCFEMLNPGGWFVNVDEMKTIEKDAYMRSMMFWITYGENYEGRVPEEKIEHYRSFIAGFCNWKIRNVDNAHLPKKKGDDLHESFIEQVGWLKDIGFRNADVFVKYHLWCVIGGLREP